MKAGFFLFPLNLDLRYLLVDLMFCFFLVVVGLLHLDFITHLGT